MIALFKNYPVLKTTLPYVSLGKFPTPVIKANKLAEKLDLSGLYIKNDGLSGELYGGNKIRKLEFHLGQALKQGLKEVLTFGGAGSNHALATAMCAKKVGLRSISMLNDQPNANYVRRNLLKSFQAGAELHLMKSKRWLKIATAWEQWKHKLKTGRFPLIIPMGGTSPLGTVGFVSAGFELKEQIAQGLLPEPDVIYVSLGSMGTAVGLLLGLTATGLKSKIIAVRVVSESTANKSKAEKLFKDTNALLQSADPSFKMFDFPEDRLEIRDEFFGPGYAIFTKDGIEAVKLVDETEDVKLEGTYTGKTFAAIIADSKAGFVKGENVLFWNTHNARDITNIVNEIDYHQLSRPLHSYFEHPVQPEE